MGKPEKGKLEKQPARLATVRVQGVATLRTEPDEAFVWLTLSALEPSPGTALGDVAARAEGLSRLLDELGVAREDRSHTGVGVNEEFDHTQEGMRSRGYRASSTMAVRLADSERLGRMIMRASTELDARVHGPSWRVSPQNPAWLEAARQAAASARSRAAAYAAGVGSSLGRLISLSESGELQHGPHIMVARARAAAAHDMPIEAGEQEVQASIWAEFVLEPEG